MWIRKSLKHRRELYQRDRVGVFAAWATLYRFCAGMSDLPAFATCPHTHSRPDLRSVCSIQAAYSVFMFRCLPVDGSTVVSGTADMPGIRNLPSFWYIRYGLPGASSCQLRRNSLLEHDCRRRRAVSCVSSNSVIAPRNDLASTVGSQTRKVMGNRVIADANDR